MNIAFWSEDDGCGTTSTMAAVASVCSNAWNVKTILMQSRSQEGDLRKKLEGMSFSGMVREDSSYYALDGLDYLLWQEKNHRLDTSMVKESIVPVVKDKMFYLPQGERSRPQVCPQELKDGMCQVIRQAEQISDFIFLDCGSGEDELSGFLLGHADVVVINLSQEKESLEACFEKHHDWRGKIVYVINQYRPESVYNRKNLNRIYRLDEEELGVVPDNTFFRSAGDRGQLERFVRRHMKVGTFDPHYYFMRELMQTAGLVLKAAGFTV